MGLPADVVKPARSVPVSTGSVGAIGTGAKGGFIFTASPSSDKMTLHDVNSSSEVVALEAADQAPRCVSVSHDALKVAFGTSAGAVYLWDILYPTTMESFRTEDSVAAGAISHTTWHPRGHVLAAASEAGVVYLWDMVVGALLFPVPCHDGPIAGLKWTANGRLFLTAGGSPEVNGTSGALRAWSARDVEFVGSVTADDDGKQKVQEKNPDDPGFRPISVAWHKSELTCLDAMVDMSRVAITGAKDGSVLLSVLKPEQGCGVFLALPSHKAAVTAVKLSPLDCPKPLRAAASSADGCVKLFDMDRRLPMDQFTHKGGSVSKLEFSDNADVLFSAAGKTVVAWDCRVAPDEAAPVEFGGHGKKVNDFAIVNGGATLVSACDDGKLRLHDMRYPKGEAPKFDLEGAMAEAEAEAEAAKKPAEATT